MYSKINIIKISIIIFIIYILLIYNVYKNEKTNVQQTSLQILRIAQSIYLYNKFENTKCVILIELGGKYLTNASSPFLDKWNNKILLIANNKNYKILSSGPDKLYNTDDDIIFDLNKMIFLKNSYMDKTIEIRVNAHSLSLVK